ncbi:hypothetical protein C8Q80DRAFT_1355208 [Daedaleopsis nitida]|nr:hypothetical protein C8Q80DRAFT_1355208 [Daedaleopsis nitida]
MPLRLGTPFPHRIRIALEEAGVDYTTICIDLINEKDWKKLLPDEALSEDAVGIPESFVILELIADAFTSAGLLPKARLCCRDVDAKLLPTFFGFFFLEKHVDTPLDAIADIQQLLLAEGFVVGQWSIADAAFMSDVGAGKTAIEALQGPRSARIQKYNADNMARPSIAKIWDEEAVAAMVIRRMERFKQTGKINVDVTLPIPKLD